VDSGVQEGDAVTPYYDPMIAKLVVHGESRDATAAKLATACRAVEVWPVRTNAAFLARVVADPDFLAGRIDTGFIVRHPGLIPSETPDAAVIARAAHALLASGETPWEALHGFQLGGSPRDEIAVAIAGQTFKAVPASDPAPIWSDGHVRVLFAGGQAWPFGVPRFEGASHAGALDGAVVAPMPGMVTALAVRQGQTVRRGEILLVLEAMKMENALVAPFDGVVVALNVQLGASVTEGTVLACIEEEQIR
jgi:3-methylcrotonyl-CoA carboxylase alpha subunit